MYGARIFKAGLFIGFQDPVTGLFRRDTAVMWCACTDEQIVEQTRSCLHHPTLKRDGSDHETQHDLSIAILIYGVNKILVYSPSSLHLLISTYEH